MPPVDPLPMACGISWGGPGGIVSGGWALKRVQPAGAREDTVRVKLLAALFESQFVGTELAAWCAPVPGGPVTMTLASWLGALVQQRCLFLEAAEQGFDLDGPTVLALVNELGLEQKLAPTVKVGTLKGTWDDHEPHGQIAVVYEFRDFDPVGFVRAPRTKTRALPHLPPAIPDAWKQRDPALLELTYPTEDPRRARLMRWLPGFFDDGTILPPLDPDMAAMFDRLGVTAGPTTGPTAKGPTETGAPAATAQAAGLATAATPASRSNALAARNALGSSDGTIARIAEEQAPGVQMEPAVADAAPGHSASTPTAPPAAETTVDGTGGPAPGGSTPARDLRRAGNSGPASTHPGPLEENAEPKESEPPGGQTGARPGGIEMPGATDAPEGLRLEAPAANRDLCAANDNSGSEAASGPEPVSYPRGAPPGFVRGTRWRVTGVDGRDGEVIDPPIWVPFATSQPEHGRWRVLLKFVPSATGPEGAYEQFVDVDKLAPPPRRRGQTQATTGGLFGHEEPEAKKRPSRRKA